jgi:hypothetical protein
LAVTSAAAFSQRLESGAGAVAVRFPVAPPTSRRRKKEVFMGDRQRNVGFDDLRVATGEILAGADPASDALETLLELVSDQEGEQFAASNPLEDAIRALPRREDDEDWDEDDEDEDFEDDDEVEDDDEDDEDWGDDDWEEGDDDDEGGDDEEDF